MNPTGSNLDLIQRFNFSKYFSLPLDPSAIRRHPLVVRMAESARICETPRLRRTYMTQPREELCRNQEPNNLLRRLDFNNAIHNRNR